MDNNQGKKNAAAFTYLGNAIRHEATKEFVACDFDLEFLKKFAKEREVARCERMKQGES